MSIYKWVMLHASAMLVILLLPWMPAAYKLLRIGVQNATDPVSTGIISTSSGDQFWFQNPDKADSAIYPANTNACGFRSVYTGDNIQDAVIDDAQVFSRYVADPRSYRIVRYGVVGRTTKGYYVINTKNRTVYLDQDAEIWHKRLKQMGVRTDIRCYSLPLHLSYAKRGWLVYQPGLDR